MYNLSVDQKLQIARIAADFAISAASDHTVDTGSYHPLLYRSKYVIDIYKVIYDEIAKSIAPE